MILTTAIVASAPLGSPVSKAGYHSPLRSLGTKDMNGRMKGKPGSHSARRIGPGGARLRMGAMSRSIGLAIAYLASGALMGTATVILFAKGYGDAAAICCLVALACLLISLGRFVGPGPDS